MNLNFDIDNVNVTEFGVGRDDANGQTFIAISIDVDVQKTLEEMVRQTWETMQADKEGPVRYEPSEKHAGTEYLFLPIDDDLSTSVRILHQAVNLPIGSAALDDLSTVFCYFVRLTDMKGCHLTALRRATQFKGVLKSRLLRLVNDSLKIIEDRVFKLDSDFDLLIDSNFVQILRPSGFEFVGDLQEKILAAVPQNIASIQNDLKFIDFSEIQDYAITHPRAARYLASIQGLRETKNIDKSALKKLCKSTGVDINDTTGRIEINPGHEMGFLEVLDRRRYEVELVKGVPERFKASSRRKLEN
jgi:hypothetical protein